MRPRPPRLWYLALPVLALGACARGPEQPAPAPASAVPRTRVVLQTDWFPQGEHGGFYQALAAGHYAAAGLDAELWPGGPGAGIRLKVARGDADFGMLRADDVLLAASRGLPLVMVMATLQHEPLALMVHANSPVRAFPDLAGRTVIGNVGMAWFPYLERRFGITFEKRQNTYGLGEFLSRPELIQQVMVTNEPTSPALRAGKCAGSASRNRGTTRTTSSSPAAPWCETVPTSSGPSSRPRSAAGTST